MSVSPTTALHKLRRIYRDAHHCDPASDANVLAWAKKPELWAEQQIRHRGWSWHATEATVRACRVLARRAAQAIATDGTDPFDPILPIAEPATDD